MPFSPQGHGLTCYSCFSCDTLFGIDCLVYVNEPTCPACGSEDVKRTGERAIKIVREWDSIEDYKEYLSELEKNDEN